MLKILDRIASGHGAEGDLELLEELCDLLADTSLCALGASAPIPVRSALKHFRPEFEAHIRQRRCPSLACRDLIHYEIDPAKCEGCLICKRECPRGPSWARRRAAHRIDYAQVHQVRQLPDGLSAALRRRPQGPGARPAPPAPPPHTTRASGRRAP